MTARKTRRLKTAVTTEDAFGTPAAARGSMMNVAGATDDDVEGELLTDDETCCAHNESLLRDFIEEALNEVIQKSAGKYVLHARS